MDRYLMQFKKVVEAGSISAAAKLLYISQPSLTQNIKKLEERIGSSLFHRSSTGITTTSYGSILYDHVRVMDNSYQQALEKIEVLKLKKVFTVQIGSGFACWEVCVKDMLVKFRQKNPNTGIHVEIGNNLYLYNYALSGYLDLFFGHEILGLDKKPGVQFIPLWEAKHCYFVRKNHPLAGKPVEYVDMDNYPWLTISHHDARYISYIKNVDQNPLEQERRNHDISRVSTNSMNVGLDLLKNQDLIFPFVAEYTHKLKNEDIVKLDLRQDAIVENVGVYVPENNIKPEVEQLVSYAQKTTIDFNKFRAL